MSSYFGPFLQQPATNLPADFWALSYPRAFAINLAVLKSLTRAEYSPEKIGHYALASENYCHFTSPIRRYADLIVHRALVDSYKLEVPGKPKGLPARTGLGEADAKGLSRIGEAISALERRAMEAERETIDRYVAAYLADQVGQLVNCRISGVQPFGFFATVEDLGGEAGQLGAGVEAQLVGQVGAGAIGGEALGSCLDQSTGELDDAFSVTDGEQGAQSTSSVLGDRVDRVPRGSRL